MSAPRTFVVNIAWSEYEGKPLTEARRLMRNTATVELTIDLEILAYELGRKALGSKAKRSRMARGNIVAKVHSLEQVPA